jgi:glycosyltransferase involved in cell wall biosynthesis
MKEKISIIIPVYKVEAYLAKCIESIINQTYTELEIILVDDGSPDQCGKICDDYAKKDARIHVIHKKNEGVARARNDGLEYASGDYISFIDSDDWIAENAYELLLQNLKKYNVDCAVGGCVTVDDKDGVLTPREHTYGPVRCEDSLEAMKHVLLSGSAVWNRLFKRKIFEELRFPVGRINDDEVVALRAYSKCRKIVFLNQDMYYYRIRSNSITTSSFSMRQMDVYYNSIDNMEFIKKNYPVLLPCAEYKFIKAMLYCYVNLRKLEKNEETIKAKKELKKMIKENRKKAMHNSYLSVPLKALACLCSL